jgi:hypothetical protein
MISDVRSTDRISIVTTPERAGRSLPADAPEPVRAVDDAEQFDGVGSSLPPEVLAQIDAGFARLQELREQGLELRYDTSDAMRVKIDLVDVDGQVVRRVPPTEAMDIVAGDAEPQRSGALPGRVDREA